MAASPTNLIHDALQSFDQGMNSGLDPFALAPKQLAFAVNATVRGNFATNRPPFQIQTIQFPMGDFTSELAGLLFQGAIYAFPDTGPQILVAQLGGRTFVFTPDTSGNVAMIEVTIPGDPNPATAPTAWLVQAERWVIINDGQSVPLFLDIVSMTMRRSELESVEQAVSLIGSQPFTPALNGTMVLTLSAPYTGPVNQSIELVEFDNNDVVEATTTYVVVQVGGAFTTYNVTLKNLADTPGATQGIGSPLVVEPSNLGAITAVQNVATTKPQSFTGVMSTPLPAGIAVGQTVSINGQAVWKISTIGPQRINIKYTYTGGLPTPLPDPTLLGAYVFVTPSSAPNTIIGNLNASFVAPAVGASVVVPLVNAYTNALPQIVYLNGKQYQVTAYTPIFNPGVGNTVTLQNINDNRAGHQFNLGTFPTMIFNFPELPVGRMMDYVQNRVWESLPNGISFIAGDQSGDPSGSPAFQFRDAVLKISGNDSLANGGFFSVPSNLGQISAIRGTAQLDASLGQGPVMIACPGGIFSCNAPSDRTVWATLTTPIVSESLIGLGGLSQSSTIVVNGDLMFRAVDGIRSLIMARRDFWSWGNTPISFEMQRVINSDNPEGLPFVSAVQFDNRMLMGCIPTQGPQGVYCQGLIALNFDPISSLQGKGASVYDGLWTGLNVLQIIEGMFSGVHRCFAFTYSNTQQTIQVYEILRTGTLDNGTTPITWSIELPPLFRDPNIKEIYDLASIEDGEFYIKDVLPGNKIGFKAEYRPDFSTCWFDWHQATYCNDPNSTTSIYGDRLGLGHPPIVDSNGSNLSKANFGRWFQQRFTFNGHCIFMGLKTSAALQPQGQYSRPLPSSNVPVVAPIYYENQLVTSGVLCDKGTLTFGGTLPRWMSINNNQVIGQKGYFVGISQEAADQAAMNAICDFINANATLFLCS